MKTGTILSYKQIGTLRKVHGKDGYLRCQVDEAFQSTFENASFLFVDMDGNKVPFRVMEVSEGPDYFILFEGVITPEVAVPMAGKGLFLPEDTLSEDLKLEIPDELDFFVGFEMIDSDHQPIGIIDRVEEYPEQLMALVNLSQRKSDEPFLIPLIESFILDIDADNKQLFMLLPDGLLALGQHDESE